MRDPSVIGQILTCPKCGSMVLVSPPETMESSSSQSATELGQDASGPSDAGTAHPVVPPQLPAVDSHEATASVDAIDPQVADEFHGDAVLPTEQWSSVSARQWRTRVQLAVAAVGGIVIAVILFGFVASKLSERKEPPAEVTEPVAAIDEDATPLVAAEDEPSTTAPDDELDERESVPDPVEEPRPAEAIPEPPAELAAAPLEEPMEPPTEASVDATSGDELPPEFATAPPGFKDSTEDAAADAMMEGGSLSEMLRNVQSLLDERSDTAEDTPAEVPPPPAATPPVEGADPLPAAPMLPRPEARDVDVAARLEDRIREIEYEDTHPIELIRFVSDFSTIPITIHPESLTWQQITDTTRIHDQQKDVTVAQVLDQALVPLQLIYENVDDQLVVRRRLKAPGGREANFVLRDLVEGSDEDLTRIAEWITSLIAPTTWQTPHGVELADDALKVHHRDDVLFEVLFFCERLRVARGRPTLSRYDSTVFTLKTGRELAHDALQKPITLTFIQPTRFTEVLRRIEKIVGVRILVDWQSLALEAWNPDAQVTFSAHEQPLGDSLEALLAPMALDFRVVAPNVLQIQSRNHLAEASQLRYYDADRWLPEGDEIETRRAELHRNLVAEFPDEAATIFADPKSRILMVLASRKMHKRLLAHFSK